MISEFSDKIIEEEIIKGKGVKPCLFLCKNKNGGHYEKNSSV